MQFSQPTQSSAGSDRLRKAIERNRRKQAKKATTSAPSPSGTVEVKTSPFTGEGQRGLWDEPDNDWSGLKTSGATRKTVGKAEKTEFATPVRQSSAAPAPVAYNKPTRATRKVSTRKKSATAANSKGINLVVKLAWGFYLFLCMRLIFSEGGIVEFYEKKGSFANKQQEKEDLLKTNGDLFNELEMIKSNARYQRKLIREHLGFISKDEYLILFPSEGSRKSI